MKTNFSMKGVEEAQENFMKVMMYLAATLIFGGAIRVKKKLLSNHFYVDQFTATQKKSHLIDSALLFLLSCIILFFLLNPISVSFWTLLYIPYYYLSFSLGLYFVPYIYGDQLHKQINKSHLKTKIKSFQPLEKELLSREISPIGISLTTKQPVFIESRKRTEHLMITGSSGQRKSSAAITLRRSDYLNGRAVIDIDPKGDKEDVEAIKEFVKLSGREDDFYHFNISDPVNSWGYDALELGSKRSKVDKCIYALDLQHEHFAGIAEEMLSLIFDVADFLDIKLSLYDISRFMISREELFYMYEKVHDLPDSEEKKDLLLRISSTKNLKPDDLKGIKSKLISLGSMELKPLLSPIGDKKINLKEVIENNRIAYFELNTLEFKNLNRVIARFIMSDLGIVASQKASGIIKSDKDFVAFYLEEALSFIDKNFPEFLRMIRSAKISMTLIFQTLAKLDTDFGPSFKSELLNDVKTSLHFATSDDIDIETITLIPGTLQTISQSFALDNMKTFGYSGRGTEFEKTEKKVHSNLPREIKEGQCLFFDKSNKYYDVIESWSSKVPGQTPKSKKELEKLYKTKHNNEPKQQYWTDSEILVGQMHPQQWTQRLTYDEIDVARRVRLQWQKTRSR